MMMTVETKMEGKRNANERRKKIPKKLWYDGLVEFMTTIWWVEFSGKSKIYFTPIFYAVHIFSLFFFCVGLNGWFGVVQFGWWKKMRTFYLRNTVNEYHMVFLAFIMIMNYPYYTDCPVKIKCKMMHITNYVSVQQCIN